ncbi:aryl-sulfate sulfotransferase [Mucilaginibacter conchicola]|uniref:aryl-sulfate sulfotransferase n=1 Tax=Mucilaginibacter conchicola TaxID=2303333 RepID=UPI0013148007|nr:aryl-sulfate sulfotransferase [Mucilaginibacter conchicola]
MIKKDKILTILLALAGLAGAIILYLYKDDLRPLRIKHIELVKLPANRLRFQVNVQTTRNCNTVLAYWKTGTKDTLYTKVSADGSNHKLFITATEGRTRYQFKVQAAVDGDVVESKTYPLVTQPIYQATPYFTLEQVDSALKPELKNKYFLTQILTEPGSMVIIDSKGEIVWYEPFKKGVKVSHWTKDKTILAIVGPEKIPSSGGDEIIEMGLDGKIITHLKKGKGDMDKLVHHEVRKDKDGNIYSLTFTQKIVDLSSVKGKQQDTVKGDGLVLFSKAGKKLWEWSVLDHLDPLADPEILKHKKDWVHGNAAFRLPDGNFLMSFRDLNQIWKIDFKTGKVLWKFGEKGDMRMAPAEYFHAQHYIHPVQDGNYMLLDNGDKTHISRAMIFKLDEAQKEAKALNIVTLPPEYYTTAKGSAALFGKKKDKVLFCLTDPRSFLITDMKGKILWRIQVGGDPYRLEEIDDFLYTKPTFK